MTSVHIDCYQTGFIRIYAGDELILDGTSIGASLLVDLLRMAGAEVTVGYNIVDESTNKILLTYPMIPEKLM